VDLPRSFTIRESSHRIHNPFTSDKLATLGQALSPPPGTRMLDLACGTGEMLYTSGSYRRSTRENFGEWPTWRSSPLLRPRTARQKRCRTRSESSSSNPDGGLRQNLRVTGQLSRQPGRSASAPARELGGSYDRRWNSPVSYVVISIMSGARPNSWNARNSCSADRRFGKQSGVEGCP
jgi:hypothetical protein